MSRKKSTELSEAFQASLSLITLQRENEALKETIDKLLKEIEVLREKTNVPKIIKLHSTPEEEILDQQIRILQQSSRVRALDLTEAKMLDLYIKNKRLLNEKSTLNADFNSLPVDKMTDEELMLLIESEKNNVEEDQTSTGSGEGSLV